MKRPCFLLLSLLLLAGCTSYNSIVMDERRNLAGAQRFFVVANASDSHGTEHRIVAALKARGLVAETGPRTMMPENTQVLLTYRDQWAWDFGEHLMYVEVSACDPQSGQPFATTNFGAKIPSGKTPAEIVTGLVARLLAGGKP